MTNYKTNRIKALSCIYIWLIPNKLLSPTTKFVLLALLFLGNKELLEIPYEELTKYTNISTSTIKRSLEELKKVNAIKIIRKMLGNIYIFQWENTDIFGKVFDGTVKNAYESIAQNSQCMSFYNVLYNLYCNKDYTNIYAKDKSLDKYFNNYKKTSKSLIRRDAKIWDSLIKPKEPLPVGEPPKKIPMEVKAIIEYWRFCGLHVSKNTTKSYRNDILAIRRTLSGRMFDSGKKYTINDFKKAITDFSGAALDSDFEPANKELKAKLASYPIRTFIRNYFAKNGNHSLFLYYLNNAPQRVVRLINDPNPKVTMQLKKFYFKHILQQPFSKLSDVDENRFRKATVRLIEFIQTSKVNSRVHTIEMSLTDAADMLCACLVNSARDKVITPIWFCNDITFESTLPRYFKERGLMVED